jgi:Starch-binding associating with outer membrane
MTMKKITILTLILSMVLYSCNWDDYGDLNVNPNASTTPKTSALLTNAMISAGGTVTAVTGALYSQMLANKQYTDEDNYGTISYSQDGWYNGPLADLDKIIRLNTDEATKDVVLIDGSNANQIAIAKIMQSYYFLFMTNRWGDLPYTEALQGSDGLLKPVFDTQETIYNGCIQSLKDAVAMIDNGAAIKGDIILGGDMARWKKFANTIRLVAALRLSKVDPTKAKTEFASAFADGVIALDNSQNVKYSYQTVQTYENPYYNSFTTAGRKDWTIADPLMNQLQINTYVSPHNAAAVGKMDVAADPRLPVYADPIENTTSTYIGMIYGVSGAVAGAVPNSKVSFLGQAFQKQNTPGWLATSAQVAFCLAEGVLKGYIAGDAKTFYEQGIKASLEFHGVGAGYATYLTNSAVAYNGTLEQIITQKWVALFPDGYEAWSEWRRTGFPVLAPAVNATNESGEIPRRHGYSTQEATLNVDNYKAALERQGWTQDNLDGRVWWDKP